MAATHGCCGRANPTVPVDVAVLPGLVHAIQEGKGHLNAARPASACTIRQALQNRASLKPDLRAPAQGVEDNFSLV